MKGGLAEDRPVRPTIVPAGIHTLPLGPDNAPPTKKPGKSMGVLCASTLKSANASAERRSSPPGTSGYETPPLTDGSRNGRGSGASPSGQGRLTSADAFTTRCSAFGFPKPSTTSVSTVDGCTVDGAPLR